MKHIKAYEYFFPGKKRDYSEQQKKNENILKIIYEEGLQYHEGEFTPKTWLRNAELLPTENRNDELITDFAGISLSYDVIKHQYELSLPPKFNREFCSEIHRLISNIFDIIDYLPIDYEKRFWTIIKFKDK